MSQKISIISSRFLEPWHNLSPWETGQGGSELTAIYLHNYLEKRGYEVNSYVPLPNNYVAPKNWYHFDNFEVGGQDENYILFRNAEMLDKFSEGFNIIFIAQDVGYPELTEERAKKLTKYVCLCKDHLEYTKKHYPWLGEKIVLSSNGIDVDRILATPKVLRNPNKIIYTSSPDRGLKLILENWFRVLERHAEAELHVFYGLNNVDELYRRCGSWYGEFSQEIRYLCNQKNIFFKGRTPQQELYKEIKSSNVAWYPNCFDETSCISCMEWQSLGAVPIANELWALKDNILHGFKTLNKPQANELAKHQQLDWLIYCLKNPDIPWREQMIQDALKRFDFNNFVNDYESWLI